MKNIRIICFTQKGLSLAKELKEKLEGESTVEVFAKFSDFDAIQNEDVTELVESLNEWTLKQQKNKYPIIFVGAMGIAVRAISEGIKDKLTDSPVLVMDEARNYVIPVVGGHMGGANLLATEVANSLDVIPVITTATDLEGSFSVDLFAKENNLAIVNREGIAKVSAKALTDKPIRLSIENYPPTISEGEDMVDVCVSTDSKVLRSGVIGLCPKQYALGIGCRKDTDYQQIRCFVEEEIQKLGISIEQIGAIGSIDLKENEPGIISLSHELHIPFITFTRELLTMAKGEYEESEFVRNKTGVGNVCERAAMLLTGNKGKIIMKKTARDGITLSVAKTGD